MVSADALRRAYGSGVRLIPILRTIEGTLAIPTLLVATVKVVVPTKVLLFRSSNYFSASSIYLSLISSIR